MDFLNNAESGDLLLFRGGHIGGKALRKITKGAQDHVAMIIRLDKFFGNELFFLESVTQRGVTLTRWEDFRVFNDIYRDVFFRKLECKRDKEFQA